ncbi:BCO2 [Branchiostoma lanceolatum]|uniref:BCO2 protein n=1 Tax=Branchiostoma lanceolatum TaxID=7740 RepID=A0A8J9Z8K5_BRALA|nr:BCO2 [Branchiostoma lanceolatum]
MGTEQIYKTYTEHPDPVKAVIKGNFPKWLSGGLVRNGPGMFDIGEDKINHWFDGLGIMHRFSFKDGEVTYRSKYLRGDTYERCMKENRIAFTGFGSVHYPDPCKNIFRRFLSYFRMEEPTDNCNVNFINVGDDYFVCTETKMMRKIDIETLDTKEKIDVSNYVTVQVSTAHPHYGLEDGATFNMGSQFGKETSYNIIKVPRPDKGQNDSLEKAEILYKIPATYPRSPSYYHSFGITDNYIVFVEQPLTMNLLRLFTARIRGVGMNTCFDFSSTTPVRFHLVNRETAEHVSTKYLADSFFVFHHINAYEDDGNVVVDLCAYTDDTIMNSLYMADLRKSGEEGAKKWRETPNVFPRRYVFPINVTEDTPKGENLVKLDYTDATAVLKEEEDGSVYVHCVHDDLVSQEEVPGYEAPNVNYWKYSGRKYQFAYGLCVHDKGTVMNKLVKLDVRNKKAVGLWHEKDMYPSEPIFIASPDSKSEDDGVIVSAVTSVLPDKPGFLLVMDAKTFTEVARAEVPIDVPWGIHGTYAPPQNKE